MSEAPSRTLILMPVFDDWETLALLVPQLDHALHSRRMRARILVVDDGSTRDPSNSWAGPLLSIDRIDRMRLRRNVGHQRAIALGLVWVHGNVKCDRIVVMDSDGEDRPADVPMLLERFEQEGGARVVFAARRRRTESAVFRLFYHAYRAVHVLLTGISVRVGNFSVVPFRALGRLVVASELWNHYAAAVFRSRLPYTTVPLARGERLQGISKMNFPSLVVHGLSAISVFSDIVGARMLAALTGLTLLSAASIGVVIALRLGTGLAIPGWATYTAGLLLVILLQAVVASFLLVFIIVSLRTGAGFLPLRDAAYFVESVDQVWPGP